MHELMISVVTRLRCTPSRKEPQGRWGPTYDINSLSTDLLVHDSDFGPRMPPVLLKDARQVPAL